MGFKWVYERQWLILSLVIVITARDDDDDDVDDDDDYNDNMVWNEVCSLIWVINEPEENGE